MLVGVVDTERRSGLDSLSAGYGALRPFSGLVEVRNILFKRNAEFVLDGAILGASASLEQNGYGNLVIKRTFSGDFLGSVILGLFVLETSSGSFNFFVEDFDLEVSVQEEGVARVLQGQGIGSWSHLFNLDGSGSSREDNNVMVAGGEVSLIEEAFDSLAAGSISVTNSTLVGFLFRTELAITTKRKTDPIDADVVSGVVALGSINDFVGPFVVEVGVFGFASEFALVLSGVREPLVVVSIKRIIVVLGTLFGTEV